MPFQNVHGPLQAPQEYVKKYSSIGNKNRRTYAAMVTAMDDAIGAIVEAYKEVGLWNDTVVVFTTDNGGPVSVGANNFPLRGGKNQLWEGGVRGVSFVRGTNSGKAPVPAGTTTRELMHSTDFVPTLSSVAGYKLKGGNPLSGVDQWDVIAKGANTTRTMVIHNCPAANSTKGRGGGIRMGDFKLMFDDDKSMQVSRLTKQTPPVGFSFKTMVCSPPQAIEGKYLFNVVSDPHECNNLASKLPDVVKQLQDAFDEYRNGAVRPSSFAWKDGSGFQSKEARWMARGVLGAADRMRASGRERFCFKIA